MANTQPTRYVFQSGDGHTRVDYMTSGITGQPTFTLTQAGAPGRNFMGSQIRTANTEIGTLVSVTSHMTIDTGSTSFSVLIPAIALASGSGPAAFTTEAIITSHSGPIGHPRSGVYETYEFILLKGEATYVVS